MLFFMSIILLLPKIQSQYSHYDNERIQCYSCSDCPEPFFYSHSQVTTTPPNYGQCMKTVVYMPTTHRHLISKGFTRNCIPESSNDVRVYCCHHYLCNRSNVLFQSEFFIILVFLIVRFSSIV
ncbi:unnamed protein product [Rotaria sordida]|uniref:Uncharacterized protein n=1 Tax=Rotaria sordida TaxID=392033 RepID=A0A814ET11_9BILA|nr:unnamed protein product [Rotaria sordida]